MAPIGPLAWEPPCAMGAALEKIKRQKKKERKKGRKEGRKEERKKGTRSNGLDKEKKMLSHFYQRLVSHGEKLCKFFSVTTHSLRMRTSVPTVFVE